jgi:hypothetical protein
VLCIAKEGGAKRMMVNCPKCGFSQPEDQYCASCGIDMLAYRPSRAPFFKRLMTSVPFQLSVLVLAIVGGFAFIRLQNQARLAARIAEIENAGDTRLIEQKSDALDTASQASKSSEAPGAQAESAPAASAPGESTHNLALSAPEAPKAIKENLAETAASPSPTPSPLPSPTATPGTTPGAATGAEKATTPSRLRVAFLEVNRGTLAELSSESRGSGGYGAFSTGTISSASAKLKSLQAGWKSLESGSPQSLRTQQPILVFRGLRDEASGHDLGVTVQVTPVLIDDTGTTVQVEVLRVLREAGAVPSVGEQSFQENFQIPRGSAAYISGVFPHRTQIPEEEARLYNSNPVLRILSSPAFQSGASEFVILIEPQ